jgi:sugar/nucleoside kinase (ribokinase family)
MLCGSYLLPRLGPRQITPYARMLRDRGQFVAFDPSWDPSGWGEETRAATLDLLGAVDCYLPNDTELLHLTGAPDLEQAIDQIAPLVPELVVKCGAEGATCVIDGVRDSVEADSIEAVNTIGAGDIFDVGYLYARRQGLSPEARLRFAGALAAMVIVQPGERVYPDAEAVWRYLGEGGHADRGDD